MRPSQDGLRKHRSSLTNIISFCDRVTRSVDDGKAVSVVNVDINIAFYTISQMLSWRNWLPLTWAGALFGELRAVWMARTRDW